MGGSLSNEGTLAVGVNSDIDVLGAFLQSPSGVLSATFGSVVDTPFAVSGDAHVDGGVVIAHAAGFVPPIPSLLTLVSASTVSGAFSSAVTPVGGLGADPSPILYEANKVIYNVAVGDMADLVASRLSGPTSAPIGSTISLSWTLTNNGDGVASGPWVDHVLPSPTDGAVGDDILLAVVPFEGAIGSNESIARTAEITLPVTGVGARTIIVRSDAKAVLPEESEENNTLVAVDTLEVTAPELTIASLDVPSTLIQTLPVTIGWTVQNLGNADAPESTTVLRWSADSILDRGDIALASVVTPTIPLASSYAQSVELTLPLRGAVPLGAGFVLVECDSDDVVVELDAAANVGSSAITVVEPPLADLIAHRVSLAETLSAGGPVAVSWVTSNAGEIAAPSPWVEQAAFLDAPSRGASEVPIGQLAVGAAIEAGSSLPHGVTGVVPNVIGVRWVAVDVDAANAVQEGMGEANNRTVSAPVTIVAADLAFVERLRPRRAEQLQTHQFNSYSIRNDGPGDSSGGLLDGSAVPLRGPDH